MEKGKIGESYIICGEYYETLEAYTLAAKVAGKRPPAGAPPGVMKIMSVLVKPLDAWLPDEYTSEGLRIIAGVTYVGDNSKAKRELGYNPRPFREGWEETLRHEMDLLGMK